MLDTFVDYFQPLGQCVGAALVGCTEPDLAVIVGFLERLVDATNGLTSGEPVAPQDASASSARRVIAEPEMD